jgi:hypothetical protein
MNRSPASIVGCVACALGCCAILTHNLSFYIEQPGEPCVYVAPCNPRPPLADLPEQPEVPPILGAKQTFETSVNVAPAQLAGRPTIRGTIS